MNLLPDICDANKTHYSRTTCITNCCRHYWCVSGVFFCRGLLTVFMWWHSSVQFVWKPLCRGDDCSFTSQSSSERGWLSTAGMGTGEICMCVGECVRWGANYFFILSFILTLNFVIPSCTHSTPMMHPCPHTNLVHKELCPLQSGYCEAQACEICLWSCLGIRD